MQTAVYIIHAQPCIPPFCCYLVCTLFLSQKANPFFPPLPLLDSFPPHCSVRYSISASWFGGWSLSEIAFPFLLCELTSPSARISLSSLSNSRRSDHKKHWYKTTQTVGSVQNTAQRPQPVREEKASGNHVWEVCAAESSASQCFCHPSYVTVHLHSSESQLAESE